METQKDSLQGVIILISALLCQLILGGITLSGGIFYVIYREAFNSSPVVTSWLCSLPMTLWLLSGKTVFFVFVRYTYSVLDTQPKYMQILLVVLRILPKM